MTPLTRLASGARAAMPMTPAMMAAEARIAPLSVLEEGELEQGHGDADDEDHRLDEAADHHVAGAVGPVGRLAQELDHGRVAAREEEVDDARRDDGDEHVDDGREPGSLVERDGDQAHGGVSLRECSRAKSAGCGRRRGLWGELGGQQVVAHVVEDAPGVVVQHAPRSVSVRSEIVSMAPWTCQMKR